MTKKLNKKLNFIDIFSGAGGLSCGFELAGFNCLLGVDHDKYASQTFKQNHKNAEVYNGPIEKLSLKKLRELIGNNEIHAIVGGPPCQGFSTVGLGKPDDKRNSLFQHFVRLVKEVRPHYIVMENVTGLVAKKNEQTLKSIFRCFERLGYTLDVQVMSSHHYGVAEKRRRTIIIGSRINNNIIFPKHTHDTIIAKTYRPPVTIGDVFKNLKDKKGKLHNHEIETTTLKSKLDEKRLKRIPEGCSIRYKKDEDEYLTKSLKLGIDWEKLPENRFRQAKYYRLNRKLPSPTIMTHRHNYFHPTENRYLTAREAARIQSFPNDFIFTGPISAQWRQIGNAVPPIMAKAIAQSIKKMFQDNRKESRQTSKSKIKQKVSQIREKAFLY